jgi:hypothetical protein
MQSGEHRGKLCSVLILGGNREATMFGPPDGISPFAGLTLEASVVDRVVD